MWFMYKWWMAWHKALHCILGYIENLYKIISREDVRFFFFFLFFLSPLVFLFLCSSRVCRKKRHRHLGRNYLDAFATQLGSRENDVYEMVRSFSSVTKLIWDKISIIDSGMARGAHFNTADKRERGVSPWLVCESRELIHAVLPEVLG